MKFKTGDKIKVITQPTHPTKGFVLNGFEGRAGTIVQPVSARYNKHNYSSGLVSQDAQTYLIELDEVVYFQNGTPEIFIVLEEQSLSLITLIR